MVVNKKQKQIILNLLKWMDKGNTELNIEEPINKPEVLQESPDDELCDTGATFMFYIDNPKQTLKFMSDNLELEKVIKYLQVHKQDILDSQKHNAELLKKLSPKNNDCNWKWPEPCDDMTEPIELFLEDSLEDDTDSLKNMGLSYQGEFIGDVQI